MRGLLVIAGAIGAVCFWEAVILPWWLGPRKEGKR